ncbi:MAG: hypothetical protein ACYTGN_00300 [Planctomycetota bacterium]|jgi:hypothetical protein
MRKSFGLLVAMVAATMLPACSSGGNSESGFQLIQFLESGKNQIARNRTLTFRFNAPVASQSQQDYFERLKIQNVQTDGDNSDFSRAIGEYIENAEIVHFVPRLPEQPDRSDAGFRTFGSYHVFLKAGPDGLQSTDGDQIAVQQEHLFGTDDNFDDEIADLPPQALKLVARDRVFDTEFDLSRIDVDRTVQGSVDSKTLLDNNNAIDPGAGGSPQYATPWQFELHVSEALDPLTVTTDNVELFEVRNNALDAGEENATDGHKGDAVDFKTPINVELIQRVQTDPATGLPVLLDTNGDGLPDAPAYERYIQVRPVQTLVDNARYRLSFSGSILGIDFRKQFIGDNGLTGDGTSKGSTTAQNFGSDEPGGIGYTTEFIVYNRPGISAEKELTYDWNVDGVFPEKGQTTDIDDPDAAPINSALYNPVNDPGSVVGFLSAFGNGSDGPLAVTGGNTGTIDTGDEYLEEFGPTFTALDLNPTEQYNSNVGSNVLTWGAGAVDSDGNRIRPNPTPYELNLAALTVSSSSVLRVIGKNPIVLRVAGITQIAGTIDVSGEDGGNAGGALAGGGKPGAGGFAGGGSVQGDNTCSYFFSSSSCTAFASYLNSCSPARAIFPGSLNGEGPGRGYAGGAMYTDYSTDETNGMGSSGGGGASHATLGTDGEDRGNGTAVGTQGTKCSTFAGVRMAGYIGIRSKAGASTYGDKGVADVYLGGSGGGPAGEVHVYNFGSNQQAGGAGGGGGGSVTIICAGILIANGGVIDATGGDGGKGRMKNGSTSPSFVWNTVAGGGGGGAGGTIALISGDDIQVTNAVLDTRGGTGGARGDAGTILTCNACNAGGDGGKGYIFLMDADGKITGHVYGTPGEYDRPEGILTVSAFDADRFSDITGVTELFVMPAADPAYQPLDTTKIEYNLESSTDENDNVTHQRVRVYMSTGYADRDEPLLPDLADPARKENPALLVCVISSDGTIITAENNEQPNPAFPGPGEPEFIPAYPEMEPMWRLNYPSGVPNRHAFLRVQSVFEYDKGVEAALGPFATLDHIVIAIQFNGNN